VNMRADAHPSSATIVSGRCRTWPPVLRAELEAIVASTARSDFATVWGRICAHAGESFRQIRGGEFTYRVVGEHVRPDRTNQQIPRSAFEEALGLVPLQTTVPLQHLRGPSYIYAILMDQRIRQDDW
jgi:hypothetical protein